MANYDAATLGSQPMVQTATFLVVFIALALLTAAAAFIGPVHNDVSGSGFPNVWSPWCCCQHSLRFLLMRS